MAIPAHLSKRLLQKLGDDTGGDFVTWLDVMRAEHEQRMARLEAMEARLLQRMDDGFAKVDARFVRVDERFAQVDVRFAGVDGRLVSIDERFAKVDQQFAQVDVRFGKVDERMAAIQVAIADSKGELMKWMLVFWVGAVGSIAALAGVLRQ